MVYLRTGVVSCGSELVECLGSIAVNARKECFVGIWRGSHGSAQTLNI
jgi:hypothetical protein